MEKKKERMKELVAVLSKAAAAYYRDSEEIMSNYEYDSLYDELEALEAETGIVLSGSPTQQVGYETLSELPKEAHPSKMLSLDKTKEVEELKSWIGDKEGLLSWKLDGLTVVLTYENGELTKAVTRGNGEIGEVITNNARVFANLPARIPCKDQVILRGEATISYSEFNRINEEIPDAEAKYKNPRNLCSGSVRQLNNEITAQRNVHFTAFSLAADPEGHALREEQFKWMAAQGFDVVEYRKVTAETIEEAIEYFAGAIEDKDEPSDGLVLIFDDIEYGRSLGVTAKFPRDAIAFKWRDEIKETILREIEWSPSRTGLINPIAIFDPVELEGTTVSRASLHNVSIMEDLKLGIGDTVTVYKANMIIPQIAENLTGSGNVQLPEVCPACGEPARVKQDGDVKVLVCDNEACPAKRTKSFSLFVSRDALNIEGLSEQTIDKLSGAGFIKEEADFFKLERYHDEIAAMEGMGEKSYENLIAAVNKARLTTPARLLYSLGIPGIGSANAGMISRHCRGDWEKIISLTKDELMEIDGVGEVLAGAFVSFFGNEDSRARVARIVEEINFEEAGEMAEQDMAGMTFVITGSLEHFGNRKELQKIIEDRGGKVAGSVSAKTTALINNDAMSSSSKNKKANELGIPIVTEEEFCREHGISV